MKTIEDARQAAKQRFRHASPFRVGMFVELLEITCANPYREGSLGWANYVAGMEHGAEQREKARAQRAAAQCEHKRVVRDMEIKGVRCLDCGASAGGFDAPIPDDVRAAVRDRQS